ncbi:MAG: AAA family ATPase, partial [Sedimenticolaceae bacterium]
MSTTYAYEQYFGLREHPFSITPDPRFVYLSESHRAALEHLDYGAASGGNGFVLLSGDVGTGKTTICRTFLERLPPKTEVILILNPVLTLNEFLLTICDELDLVIEGNRDSNKNLIDNLNRFLLQVYAVGHKTILIVDEAQNLTHELLEQIRLLTNLESNTDKLLQIFLIGQPELRDMLKRPELLQVSQRITSRFHLGPLNKKETRAYIERRLEVAGAPDIPFTASAIRRIYAFSKGVPRLINVLCDKALLSAYQRSAEKIDAKIILDAERRVLGNGESSRGGIGKAAMVFG